MAKDGIGVVIGNKYGKGLGRSQKDNFAPRFGFAYQVTPKLVARGGFGLFYNGFENRGFSPNLGENYPFQFNFQFAAPNDSQPITYPGCTSPGEHHWNATWRRFSCTPLDPTLVNASGLALRGIQFDYTDALFDGRKLDTPVSVNALDSAAGRLRNLAGAAFGGVPRIPTTYAVLPVDANLGALPTHKRIPFPDFGQGAVTQRPTATATTTPSDQGSKSISAGLNFLATYTWSKARSDADRSANNGSAGQGYRAPDVPGAGIAVDYGLASISTSGT